MNITYIGKRHLNQQDAEVYTFDTNLKITPYHDDESDQDTPGFYYLLEKNQPNQAFPYYIKTAAVKYKKKGTGINGIPTKMVKKQVPLEYVELTYERYQIDQWMFEIESAAGDTFVARIWNSDGTLEIASFQDEPGRVEDFINEALYDENDEFYNEEPEKPEQSEPIAQTERKEEYMFAMSTPASQDAYKDEDLPEDAWDDLDDDLPIFDDQQRVDDDESIHGYAGQMPATPREMDVNILMQDIQGSQEGFYENDPMSIEYGSPETEHDMGADNQPQGIPQSHPYEISLDGQATDEASIQIVPFAAVEMTLFMTQLVPSILSGSKIMSIFSGACAIIALIALVLSIVKTSQKKRNPSVSTKLPQTLVYILLGALVLEFIACVIIGVLWALHMLPVPLQFMYQIF